MNIGLLKSTWSYFGTNGAFRLSYKMITLAKIMKIGPKINNLELLLDIKCFLEAKNIKYQFHIIWYPWLKSWILGLSQSEATFGHLEPPESQKYQISVSCNLIPLVKIMNIGLKINLKLLLDIWSLQEAKNIKFQCSVIWYPWLKLLILGLKSIWSYFWTSEASG